jgi:DNA-binding transcriptional ArsR family regulator
MGNRRYPPTDPELFAVLGDARRRRILTLLQDRTSAVGLQELATYLVAGERDKPLVEVGAFDVERIRPDLVHNQLPRLEDAGLVRWDRSEQSVATTDHPALLDPTFERIVATMADGWDDVLANLADKHRRLVLATLADHDGSMTTTDLAEEVAARDSAIEGDADTRVQAKLYHVHLPKLRQAGLVSYDGETVAYEGHPALEEEWLAERPRVSLSNTGESDAIWTVEGRDNVIARGQSLFEQAEDELFLMVTTAGLLEEDCVRGLQDAVARGVDVYLGSQTKSVRDLVRERVPEAIIWEPQMDWLNLPPEYEKVGRLVFADRKAVMLGTLGEETDTGVHAETAVTGAGEDNPLVVLLRDMLGSRLDHLDAQSEDFLSELPL